MTKLSTAQNGYLARMLQHEYSFQEQSIGAAHTSKTTIDSLTRKELIIHCSVNRWQLTATGRVAAIDLLHESAAKKMEDDFISRQRESDLRTKELYIRDVLAARFKSICGMFYVHAAYNLRDSDTLYIKSVRFGDMSIEKRGKGYVVVPRGLDLDGHRLTEYYRTLGVCIEILESGILDS